MRRIACHPGAMTSGELAVRPSRVFDLHVVTHLYNTGEWWRRPAYLALASLRSEFAGAPVMACTATATKPVRAAIIESLRLKAPVVLDASANRERP